MVDPERHRMSRSKKKKGVIETKERFVRLTYELLETEAWLHLTPSSIKVYIELRRRFNGSNNGQIHLSLLAGAKKLNMSKTTVKRALDQLILHGLIRCAERGYFTGRQASRFILTNERDRGHTPTKEYRNFRPRVSKRKIPEIGIKAVLRELKEDP